MGSNFLASSQQDSETTSSLGDKVFIQFKGSFKGQEDTVRSASTICWREQQALKGSGELLIQRTGKGMH